MAQHKVLTTNEDIQKALAGASAAPEEPVVVDVTLTTEDDKKLLSLRMSDESRYLIPIEKMEHLAEAPYQTARNVEITEGGLGLRWPDLDLDLYVPAILRGIYGTQKWMSSLGQQGGRSRSEAKTRAARENGRKGGRPRKCIARVHHRQPEKHTSAQQSPSGSHSVGRPSDGYILYHNRASYAVLFGLSEESVARQLPRIA